MSLLKKALLFSAFFMCLIYDFMKKSGWLIKYVFLLAIFTVRAHAVACPPQHIDESVRVNYVYDGDTIQLEDGRKIRLVGIDTAEIYSRHHTIPADLKASGEKARAALQQQLNASKNRVSLAYGPQRFDRYRRTLAHVFLMDGTNLQAWLIEQGYAIAFTTPPNDRMSVCYRKQEEIARRAKKGIWQMPQYSLKRVSQLNKNSSGFHRIQAIVTRIWQNQYTVSFFLDGGLEVKIYKPDLINFNAHMLNSLQGKNVVVRGWLKQKKPTASSSDNNPGNMHFGMSLRHPDAIRILNTIDINRGPMK